MNKKYSRTSLGFKYQVVLLDDCEICIVFGFPKDMVQPLSDITDKPRAVSGCCPRTYSHQLHMQGYSWHLGLEYPAISALTSSFLGSQFRKC